jgi:Zn-dependent protease with chaperone function
MLVLMACALGAQGCGTSAAARASWERSRGGLASSPVEPRLSAERPRAALARVAPACCTLTLSVSVLQNDAPAAHSFKDGALYVSTGLLARLTDDELAAVLAHELGHLMIDGLLTEEPAALSGKPAALAGADVELHADLLARSVLRERGISPRALTSALQKVAAASSGETFYAGLTRRVAKLQGMDGE